MINRNYPSSENKAVYIKAKTFCILFLQFLRPRLHVSPEAVQLLRPFEFLDGSTHLYMRVCPPVRRMDGPSVRRSVDS